MTVSDSVGPTRRVHAAEHVEHLVITVGGSPVPLLLSLLGLRPGHVTALCTGQSAAVWTRVEKAFAHLVGRPLPVDVCTVSESDPRTSREAYEAAEARWGTTHLAYSGGSPAMTAGAASAWARSADTRAFAWYVAEEGDALLRNDGLFIESTDILGGRNIALAQLLALHGMRPTGLDERPERYEPLAPDRTSGEICGALAGLPKDGARNLRDKLDRQATSLVGDALAFIAASGSAQAYGPTKATYVRWGQQTESTVDLPHTVVRGLGLKVVQTAGYTAAEQATKVTLRWKLGDLKELLFDTGRSARTAGGMHADAAVVSLESTRRGDRPTIAALYSDIGPLANPSRLPEGTVGAVPQLPQQTAFSREELREAVLYVDQGGPVDEGPDMVRWITGATR